MTPRCCRPACWILCLGCHSLFALQLDADPEPAQRLWEQGQSAMRQGEPARAIALYRQSLQVDRKFTRSYLSLSAAYLESGNEAAACEHLGKYLTYHPDECLVRSHYAELLWRRKRLTEAHHEFERVLADAQDHKGPAHKSLVHTHGRLMEFAELVADPYGVRLHRGIGLFLLACGRAELDDPEGELPAEGLLVKAAQELTQAHELRPHEAQPCWYLFQTWNRLGQRQTARRWLAEAQGAAPLSTLSAAEQRRLRLATTSHESLPRR
jgi:hypothetical protein